jgi:hypothetical protein
MVLPAAKGGGPISDRAITKATARVELPRFSGRFNAWVTSGYPQAGRGALQTHRARSPVGNRVLGIR